MKRNLPALTLYTRHGCHLCEDMQQALQVFQQTRPVLLNVVDVDADSYLKLRYGERVPVLAAGDVEICHFRFNPEVLLSYLNGKL